MSGGADYIKRTPPKKEITYLDQLIRGVYAKNKLPEGHVISDKDIYLAVPLLKGQLSCRELMAGEILLKPVKKNQPIFIDMIDSPYAFNESLKQSIYERGIEPNKEVDNALKKNGKKKYICKNEGE